MAPILNSTTGMIPQDLENRELCELLRRLNALQPLNDVKIAATAAATTNTSDDNLDRVGDQERRQGQSDQPALLPFVQQLTELLHPYKDHWSFDETVRSLVRSESAYCKVGVVLFVVPRVPLNISQRSLMATVRSYFPDT